MPEGYGIASIWFDRVFRSVVYAIETLCQSLNRSWFVFPVILSRQIFVGGGFMKLLVRKQRYMYIQPQNPTESSIAQTIAGKV